MRERIKHKDKERESGTRVRKRHTQKKEGKNKVPVGVSWYNNGRGLIL